MVEYEFDVLLLSVGADLPYLTGYAAMPLERLTMLVVTLTDAMLVVPELEAPRVEAGPFDVRVWGESDDPIELVADVAGDPSVAAVGDQTWSVFLMALQARMDSAVFRSATPLMSRLRIQKDPDEIECLRRAAQATDRVVERLADSAMSGLTERQLARRVRDWVIEEGHDAATFAIVGSGPNGASPHHEPTDREISAGDVVVIDFGGTVSGYHSDETRTFVVGAPSSEQSEVHGVVLEANSAAHAVAGPDVLAADVDAAARRIIDEAGYGEYFIHRTGHGIGLDAHEDPYLVGHNDAALERGMAFSIEPGIYLPGRLGVRVEDIVVVGEDGVESLNDADRSLMVVG